MKQYEPQSFNIPELKGISKTTTEEHLKLYAGYVKHTNLILNEIESRKNDVDSTYALSEMQRRFAFEFDGMRNHEYYFRSLEGGSKKLTDNSDLKQKIETDFGSYDAWLDRFKTIQRHVVSDGPCCTLIKVMTNY